MAFQAFQSRHLHGGDYDPESQTLTIRFLNGAIYAYRRVPQTAADSLFQTGSSQDYFNDKIKGVYPYVKLQDGKTKSGNMSRRKQT